MKSLIVPVVLLLAACSKEEPAMSADTISPNTTAASTVPSLSWTGYGPVIFGSKLTAVEQAIGPRSNNLKTLDAYCDHVTFPTLPGVTFMVEQEVVTRAEVESGIGNVLGIRVGTSLAEVTAAHPEARITPHKYDETGHYVSFASPDGTRAIVMEASAEKIVDIRAGLEPSVNYVEGCL